MFRTRTRTQGSGRGHFSKQPGGSSSSSSGFRRGGNNGGYFGRRGGGGSRGFSRGRSAGPSVHYSRYINKATPVEDVEEFVPQNAFADFEIDQRLKKNIAAKGYVTPTPIQDRAIPVILEGRDIVGIANTGTGKTGAFMIPLLHKILKEPKTRILIMVPTRELALQIFEDGRGFAKGLGLGAVCVVGGANIRPQITGLRHDPQVVIGTPGRLKDVMQQRALDLSKFSTVVLDEADRMLDMGFIGDMRFILSHMQEKRHTLFFSATLSNDIERLISDFLSDPVRISVKTRDTSHTIDQDIVRVETGKTKIEQLTALLSQPEFNKVLIFGRTKHGVERLMKLLKQAGFHAESIHGNKTHSNRQRALSLFKNDKVSILVATDVAARGLDIDDVSHVINYELPTTYDDYVHRIGRTGRAGKRGKALTFVE